MIRPRGPTFGGSSKATPQTLCQKCLKRDSYECKSTAPDRPYVSRPSRTQQLANPKLVPKLTSDVPNDLLRKRGVADDLLAKNAEERGRKRAADENDVPDGPRKRSRSMRSYSSSSVSTISTRPSRSASPVRTKAPPDGTSRSELKREPLSMSSHNGVDRKRRRRSRSSSLSYTSDSSSERKDRRRGGEADRNTRRRRSSISPETRGRDRDYKGNRRTRSQRESRDRSQVARNRNSMTPAPYPNGGKAHTSEQRRDSRDQTSMRYRGQRYSNDNDRYGSSFRDGDRDRPTRDDRPPTRGDPFRQAPQFQRKDRSLSPFSKRLALTQAMNMGH